MGELCLKSLDLPECLRIPPPTTHNRGFFGWRNPCLKRIVRARRTLRPQEFRPKHACPTSLPPSEERLKRSQNMPTSIWR